MEEDMEIRLRDADMQRVAESQTTWGKALSGKVRGEVPDKAAIHLNPILLSFSSPSAPHLFSYLSIS